MKTWAHFLSAARGSGSFVLLHMIQVQSSEREQKSNNHEQDVGESASNTNTCSTALNICLNVLKGYSNKFAFVLSWNSSSLIKESLIFT